MVLSFVLAYILTPLANALQARLKVRRILATLLCYLIVLVVIIVVPAVIIPLLGSQLEGLNLDLQLIVQEAEQLLAHPFSIAGYRFDGSVAFQQVLVALQGMLDPLFRGTLEVIFEVLSSVVWVIFVAVVTFYLIKDGPKLRDLYENAIPLPFREDYISLREEINVIWSSFFRGQLLLALVVAVIFTVVGFILGLPFALAMGVLAGLLEFLPSVGHGIWMTIAAILALFAGSAWLPIPNWAFMLIVVGLHLFYQQFDLNYLIPRIVGHSVHLPPLVVILGIVAGALLGGVLGILLAAPTIASARILGRYIYAHLFDLEPFPDKPALPPTPNPRWWQRKGMKDV
jgi:predicted PurR-regulated permease PerM